MNKNEIWIKMKIWIKMNMKKTSTQIKSEKDNGTIFTFKKTKIIKQKSQNISKFL